MRLSHLNIPDCQNSFNQSLIHHFRHLLSPQNSDYIVSWLPESSRQCHERTTTDMKWKLVYWWFTYREKGSLADVRKWCGPHSGSEPNMEPSCKSGCAVVAVQCSAVAAAVAVAVQLQLQWQFQLQCSSEQSGSSCSLHVQQHCSVRAARRPSSPLQPASSVYCFYFGRNRLPLYSTQ